MSTTDQFAYSYAEEATPAGATLTGRPYLFPKSSVDGSASREFAAGDEARPDSLDTPDDLTARDGQITVNAHLRGRKFDPFMEQVFFGRFAAKPTRTNVFGAAKQITAFDEVTNTYTVTTGDAFDEGDLVLVEGVATALDGLREAQASSGATSLIVDGASVAVSPIPDDAQITVVGRAFASGDVSFDATGKTLSSASSAFAGLPIGPGDWIKIGGAADATKFATASNNDFVRVLTKTDDDITFDRTLSTFADDNGTGKTIHIYYGERLTNGNTLITHRWQTLLPIAGASSVITHFLGAQAATLSITGEARGRLNVAVSIMARDFDDETAANMNGDAILPPQQRAMVSGLAGQRAYFGGTMNFAAMAVENSEMVFDPTLLPVDQEGLLGYGGFDPSTRRATLTGAIKFRNRYIFDAHRERQNIDFARVVSDGINAYVFEMPALQVTGFEARDAGRAQHVTADFEAKATPNDTLGAGFEKFAQIVRFRYAPGVNQIR